MAILQIRQAIRDAMKEEMLRDERVFLMGEEVGYYNGAYKASEGLLEQFGPKRVIDTPIVETGFAGVGIGAAMCGLRPIIEFMTFNFSAVAFDQIINNAAKIRHMTHGQFGVPIVFRGPNAAAHMLGSTHSQAFEPYYAHIPGLKVVAVAIPYDAKGLLKTAIRDDNPVLFIEHKLLYVQTKGPVPQVPYAIPIGKADIKRPGRDVTIVATLALVAPALRAAEQLAREGIEAEVIDPRTLRPLDTETIVESVKRTSRLVIVHEGWKKFGFGAEVAAVVQEEAFDYLDAPITRLGMRDVPMPYNDNLERAVIPTQQDIFDAVKAVCYR